MPGTIQPLRNAVLETPLELAGQGFTEDGEPVVLVDPDDLTAYVPTTRTINGHPLSNNVTVTKGDVGLSNVDNTSDVNKPVSTAQGAADTAVANGAASALSNHANNTTNPHNVTKTQVGLGNVDNTTDLSKPISTATQTALDGKAADSEPIAATHAARTDNPHAVSKAQVGLSNVTNDAQIPANQKGAAGGVAELDGAGLVPSAQLPSFVDDVIEAANFAALPATGVTGKIYVTLDDNKTYRWSGSVYVEISSSLALGETSSTAYRGDRGKTAYDHSQLTSGNPHGVTKSDVGLGNVDNTSDASKPISSATQTALNAKANSGANSDITSLTALTTALSVAQGGTGDTGTAWTAYTPTVTAESGTFTTVSATGRYKKIGRTVFFTVNVNITTNGSATTGVRITLPVNGPAGYYGAVSVLDFFNIAGVGIVLDGNILIVKKYDGSYLGGSGNGLNITGVYESAT